MAVDKDSLDKLVAEAGPKLFSDPFRQSTRQQQQQLTLASAVALVFALRLLEIKEATVVIWKLSTTNTSLVAVLLGGFITYLLVSFTMAAESDWQVFYYTVLPFRLEILTNLAILIADKNRLHSELEDLVRRRSNAPEITHEEQVQRSLANLRKAGLEGPDLDAIVGQIENQLAPLKVLTDQSGRLLTLRRYLDVGFTYLLSIIALVALWLQLRAG